MRPDGLFFTKRATPPVCAGYADRYNSRLFTHTTGGRTNPEHSRFVSTGGLQATLVID
ncbi:hypothetical protein [Spirosoma rhododendri]|uniref:Uncharacterized protein n=1 Tax=Spirosoma rhododendri TaxID=2728024 RepID=A0A7L5DH00_9BACT|nr:hypothetical protein [Spirosoma rhododendri]QJD77566.1 hypothetical protein HH216_03405 [Spirosoma rhododendri]